MQTRDARRHSVSTNPTFRRFLVRMLGCFLSGLFLAGAATFAQVESGQIAGTVMDPSGAAIPVHRSASNLANGTERFAHVSDTGAYVVVGLEPGTYQVSATANGFQQFRENIEVTGRNEFRGPGAWNTDAAAAKRFHLTEHSGIEFRAEAFDLFNHHNLYVNEAALSVTNTPGSIGAPLGVIAEKGGLNSIALGGNHDERRFGQFSLRFDF